MLEEEKEAIEIVDNKIWNLMNTVCGNCIIEDYERDNYQEAIEIVLNLLKKQDKEINCLEQEKQDAWEEWNNLEQSSYEEEKRLKSEIEKKDKIIDLIINKLNQNYNKVFESSEVKEIIEIYEKIKNISNLSGIELRKECIKQYFENKVNSSEQ